MTNQNNENNPEITYQNALEQYSKEIMNTPTKPAPAPAGERIEEVESVLAHYAQKYDDLVWYARKQPQEDTEYWGKHAPEIRNSAFNAMDEIEQKYPDEVAKLNGEFPARFNSQNVPEELREQLTKAFINTDWEHGFNSGCLAAFRFALTALDRELYWNDEFEEWLPTGGIEDAVSEFPELDT